MLTIIELKYHQAVVALAEELNYTRAADRLGFSQPALTKQIMEVERQLGYSLFERNRKHVILTAAGEAFVQESRLALVHAERAVHLGRSADHGREHVVTVGRTQYTDPDLVAQILALRLPMYPNLRVQLESSFSLDLVRSVATAALDMAIVAEVPETKGITQVALSSAPLCVGLQESHPAATLDRVHLKDIDGYDWALFAKRVHPILYDTLFQIAQKEKVRTNHIHHVMSAQEALPLVAEHECVVFVTAATARRNRHHGIVFRPLAHESFRLHTSLIMRSENGSKLINGFVRSLLKRLEDDALQKDLFQSHKGSGISVD